MKTILLLSLILLLSSCTKYRYDITYKNCDGNTGNIQVYPIYVFSPCRIQNQNGYLYDSCGSFKKSNVCDFSYQRNPIE